MPSGRADGSALPQTVARALEAALAALRVDPARTTASVLAIATGVATIVALVAVSSGGRREMLQAVEAAGPANVFLHARAGGEGRSRLLTTAETQRIARRLDGTVATGALRSAPREVVLGPTRQKVSVYAVDEGIPRVFRMAPAKGRLLGPLDVLTRARRGVLGTALARDLAPSGDVLGARLTIDGEAYEIVGVLRPLAADPGAGLASPGPVWDRGVLVPLGSEPGSAVAPAQDYPVDTVVLRFPTPSVARRTARLLERLEKRLHAGAALSVSTPLQALEQYRTTRRISDRIVAVVAVLTTLGTGFGVSNLLWSAVRARRSEIGLRRAVGAPREEIRRQFLAEGLLLGVAGGALGVCAGVVISLTLLANAGFPPHFDLAALAAMVAAVSAVGVLAGLRPAAEAVRIDPSAALRIE